MKRSIAYLVAEVIMIFLGLFGAFTLDEWGDEKKRQELINEVMLQVIDDLEENIDDLKSDKDWHRMAVVSNAKLMHFIDNELPYEASLCFDFDHIQADEYVVPITTGYKRLINFDVNSSVPDSIISSLSRIYEVLYPRIIKTTSFHPDLNDYYQEYFEENFIVNTDSTLAFQMILDGDTINLPVFNNIDGYQVIRTKGFIPKDYDKIMNDPKFRLMLARSFEIRLYKYNRYRILISETEKTISNLSQIYTKKHK